jgi:hypothetical protein
MNERNLPEQLLKLGDQQADFIILSTGFTTDGLPYYAYVKMKPSRYVAYIAAIKREEPFRLGSFGEIVAKGFGHEPPEDVAQRMANEYGLTLENQKALEAFADDMLAQQSQRENEPDGNT